MKVSHFGGAEECRTIEELKAVLSIRYGDEVNEFWISGEEGDSCLAVLVNKSYANLTYFPKEGSMGFVSIGEGAGLDPNAISIFYTNTPEEEIEVRNDAVVPFNIAVEVVMEFFNTRILPKTIKWLEM